MGAFAVLVDLHAEQMLHLPWSWMSNFLLNCTMSTFGEYKVNVFVHLTFQIPGLDVSLK
jgi:hypothetical protein